MLYVPNLIELYDRYMPIVARSRTLAIEIDIVDYYQLMCACYESISATYPFNGRNGGIMFLGVEWLPDGALS